MSDLTEIKNILSEKINELEKENKFLKEQVRDYNRKILFLNDWIKIKGLVKECHVAWYKYLNKDNLERMAEDAGDPGEHYVSYS